MTTDTSFHSFKKLWLVASIIVWLLLLLLCLLFAVPASFAGMLSVAFAMWFLFTIGTIDFWHRLFNGTKEH